MRLLGILVLVGCDAASTPPPDAAMFHYGLITIPSEPGDRPPATTRPEIYFDSVQSDGLGIDYPSFASAVGIPHTIELRFGDQVLVQVTRVIGVNTDDAVCSSGVLTSYSETFCEYDSGDLRFASDGGLSNAGQTTVACSGDGVCAPSCSVNSCGAGMRCTRRITSIDPPASHLGCAPVGPNQIGDPCIELAGGSYDDCGNDALCVDGTCHALCDVHQAMPCPTCSYVPGAPPELQVCL